MSELRLVSLGGVGNVTQNMFVYEYDNEMLLVDCGIGFPDSYMPGVDILIPDISYVLAQVAAGKQIVGMVLTHGHDDHIGALPYLLPHLPVFAIYGSPLTIGFAQERVKETPVPNQFQVLEQRQVVQLGRSFRISSYHMTHSVPDTRHLLIETPEGSVYHGSDFKLDPTPVDQRPSDLEHIGMLKEKHVGLMLIDCLRVEELGPVPSEITVGPTLRHLMGQTRGKAVVTLMSSHIHRIQQTIDAAQDLGRKVAFVGRSVEQNVVVAEKLGLLHLPASSVVDKKDMDEVPDEKLCVIVAGSQGQEGSSLVRAVFGEHQLLSIGPDDSVIFSADAIPGSEHGFYHAVDELCRNRIHVVYPAIMPNLHQSGHASRTEQQQLLSLLSPGFVMPIGGVDRHRYQFINFVAQPCGYRENQVILPEQGQVVVLKNGQVSMGESVPLTPQIVDGLGVGDVGPAILSDRRNLSQAGMVVVVVPRVRGKVRTDKIEVVSRGFVFLKEAPEVATFIKDHVKQALNKPGKHKKIVDLKREIERSLGKALYKIIHREPMILVAFVDIE